MFSDRKHPPIRHGQWKKLPTWDERLERRNIQTDISRSFGSGQCGWSWPQDGHETQWAAIVSVSSKVGCSAEALRKWVRRVERDMSVRPGLTSEERERFKALERENLKLCRANEILLKASTYFA